MLLGLCQSGILRGTDLTKKDKLPARVRPFLFCLHRVRSLRCELEEQRQAEKSLAAVEATTCGCPVAGDQPTGVDKSCQKDSIVVVVKEGETQTDDSASITTASTFRGENSGSLTADEASVAASAAKVLAEEAEKRVAMAVAAVAAAESGAAAWARAFFSAKRTVYTALLSVCEHAAGLWGAEDDGWQAIVLPLLEGVKAGCAESGDGKSSAVVPWVPAGEVVETEPMVALEALRGSVDSTVEDIRAALAGHAAAQPGLVQRSTSSTGSQTTPLSQTTTGSQTVPRSHAGSQREAEKGQGEGRKRDAVETEHGTTLEGTDGVGVDRVGRRGEDRLQGVGGGAPAWEGGSPGRSACSERHHRDEQGRRRRRQPQAQDASLVEELRRKEGALKKVLQRTKAEKRDLERSLTLRFERERVRDGAGFIGLALPDVRRSWCCYFFVAGFCHRTGSSSQERSTRPMA